MSQRLRSILFFIGILLLIIPEAIVFYLLMPIPTSQQTDQLELGHLLYKVLWYSRITGLLFSVPMVIQTLHRGKLLMKIFILLVLLFAGFTLYLLGYRFMPENIFKEPKELVFALPDKNEIPMNNYVLGVELNGESKAYPLKFVGYHHKIQDVVGGVPVLVTYCTMCRTGMVYDPVIHGKKESFRLVGAAFNNAVIEDGTTKSWWYQSTGMAGAGPLKGTALKVIPFEQMTLSTWISQHPETKIMQPDPHFIKEYAKLKNYDINVPAANTDPAKNKSFLPNSWVIGVFIGDSSKAFLWNELTEKKVINTTVNHQPVMIALQKDGYSFHAFKRNPTDTALTFIRKNDSTLMDEQTSSLWNWKGACVSGNFEGKKLKTVQAYQTYYHSWERFYGNKHRDSKYSLGNNKFLVPDPERN